MKRSAAQIRALAGIVRDRMAETGIDNYAFANGELLIGSLRYAVEACGCGASDCDGLRLRPVHHHLPRMDQQRPAGA